jgi:hypothetical protein
MYAEMELYDAETLVLPQPINVPARIRPSAGPRLAPPRLTAVPMAHPTAPPRVTMADLRLPADLVHTQASAQAESARAAGAQHSMRPWRDACRAAIISLARAATATPESASCEALYWELSGDEYHVSATFARASAAMH